MGAAITEMHRQVGDLVFDHHGLAKCGLLVRHLVMPGHKGEARDILTWLHSLSPDTYVNVMEQYRPSHKVGTGELRARTGFTKYEDIDRPVEISDGRDQTVCPRHRPVEARGYGVDQ